MRRRRFVGALSAGLAAAGVPLFISRAFAQTEEPEEAESRAAVLRAAVSRARDAGRPLLVVVIPERDGAKWERGYAWGELLNHGSDAQLAPLALVELVAARRVDLTGLVPSLRAASGDPVAVLVETSGEARARVIDPELAETSWNALPPDLEWHERELVVEARITQRIASLADAIADAVAPNLIVLSARAHQRRARLSASDVRRVEQGLAGERRLSADLAGLGAALVALHAHGRERAVADSLRARLAASVRHRVQDGPPPGARWARSTGCGVYLEDPRPSEEHFAIGCGMGHVPERSQRFLYMFTRGS